MLSGQGLKGDVLLFLPPYAGPTFGPPLGLLSLVGSLREAGYRATVVDGAVEPNYLKRITEELPQACCFGVSLLTGPMILDAIKAARYVRSLRPELPIIFGGWHPSLTSEQTLREDYVDIVVRHQGERTLIEILGRLANGSSLDLVAGCWFKRSGRIIRNPDRATTPIGDLPLPAYDVADFGAYARAGRNRKLPYATSIGCPYACNYCTDMVFYKRRFNALPADRVVNEMTALARRYALDEVALVDSNFLVDVSRAIAIARGIRDSGARFRWTFQASTDLLCRMSDEEVGLLGESGVRHIGFGTESASPEVLREMNKRHQQIPDIAEAARKCARAGIRVTLNLIFGYPGEEERHRRETLRVMGEIAARYDNVTFSPNLFTAYPGIPIWPELRAAGVPEPTTLEAWSQVDLGLNRLPWIEGPSFLRLRRSISYFLLDSRLKKARRAARSATLRKALTLLRQPLDWRLRNAFFGAPFELGLSMAGNWLAVRRSLLTGQPLSKQFSKAS
jgi:anaerobic magnesium-protoporphyrin IX monomethyl ester cyclase